MNIEKFNDEGMIFKTYVHFKNGDITIIYLGEREITRLMARKWANPFFAYTNHIDTCIRMIDDIRMIHIVTDSVLTETEYEAMLDELAKKNYNQCVTVNVITDEKAISDGVKFLLERRNK